VDVVLGSAPATWQLEMRPGATVEQTRNMGAWLG
jgi:hypothetical protein